MLECHTLVIQILLQPFRCNSLLKCLTQPEIAQNFTKNPYFGRSRSSKVIDVNTNKKLATIACYDRQNICAYLQPFSRYTSQ